MREMLRCSATLRVLFLLSVFPAAVSSNPLSMEDQWQESPGIIDMQLQNGAQGAIDTFKQYLQNPPKEAVTAAATLEARATSLVNGLSPAHKLPAELDVVVSGGGNLDGYYMGVSMVLRRLKGVTVKRYAGASAGGMMPFEEALMGQKWTLLLHLAFGVVQDKHYGSFGQQVDMWNIVAKQICAQIPAQASKLNGKVFLALSCKKGWFSSSKQLMVSQYTNPSQAAAAYIGTGSFGLKYEGMSCSDGASTSGKNMTPLFHDKQRAQLIIDLMKTGTSISGLVYYSLKSYMKLIQKGQDDMIAFLKTGHKVAGVSMCPKGEKTDTNICGGCTGWFC